MFMSYYVKATLFVLCIGGGESVMFIATGDYYTSSLSVCRGKLCLKCVGNKTGSALTSLSRGISSNSSCPESRSHCAMDVCKVTERNF